MVKKKKILKFHSCKVVVGSAKRKESERAQS